MSVKNLEAYEKALKLSSDIFMVSETFPDYETDSLTRQIRRTSKAVYENIVSAYRKRKELKHFIKKLTNSNNENFECKMWMKFASASNYLKPEEYQDLKERNIEVGELINFMINNPKKFTV